MVLDVIASANRDETELADADRLDIRRENNKHLAFGQGVHYCLGVPLARLEGQIAVPYGSAALISKSLHTAACAATGLR